MSHFKWTHFTRAIRVLLSAYQASKATWSRASSIDWVTTSSRSQSFRLASGLESTSRCWRRWRRRMKSLKFANTTRRIESTLLLRFQNSAKWMMLRFWKLSNSKQHCQQQIWFFSLSPARYISMHRKLISWESFTLIEWSYMIFVRSSCWPSCKKTTRSCLTRCNSSRRSSQAPSRLTNRSDKPSWPNVKSIILKLGVSCAPLCKNSSRMSK